MGSLPPTVGARRRHNRLATKFRWRSDGQPELWPFAILLDGALDACREAIHPIPATRSFADLRAVIASFSRSESATRRLTMLVTFRPIPIAMAQKMEDFQIASILRLRWLGLG